MLIIFDDSSEVVCPDNAALHHPALGHRYKTARRLRSGGFFKINIPLSQFTSKHPVVRLVTENLFQPVASSPKYRHNELFSERTIGLISRICIRKPESALSINDKGSFTPIDTFV